MNMQSQKRPVYIEDYCSTCRNPLPRKAIFCEHCGPKKIVHDHSIDAQLPIGKTIRWIAILTIIFGALIFFKLDIKQDKLGIENQEIEEEVKSIPEVPKDKDYEIFHYINVNQAFIRDDASSKANIVMVVTKEDKITVLEKGDHWTKVKVNEKIGWVGTRLLTGTIE